MIVLVMRTASGFGPAALGRVLVDEGMLVLKYMGSEECLRLVVGGGARAWTGVGDVLYERKRDTAACALWKLNAGPGWRGPRAAEHPINVSIPRSGFYSIFKRGRECIGTLELTNNALLYEATLPLATPRIGRVCTSHRTLEYTSLSHAKGPLITSTIVAGRPVVRSEWLPYHMTALPMLQMLASHESSPRRIRK